MADQEQPFGGMGGMAGDQLKRLAKKKLWLWILGGGLPVLGGGFVIFIVILASMILLAGMGQWFAGLFGPSPPAIATPMSRPAEWLSTVSQAGARTGIPNVLALAVIQQASGGQVFGDRYYCSDGQSSGIRCHTVSANLHTLGVGEGLFGIDTNSGLIPKGQNAHSVTWNVSTGMQALGRYLSGPWKTGLTTFHHQAQVPPSWASTGYADRIESLIRQYDAGPQLGAWALASWKHGQFVDPGNAPAWVFAVGSAPTGFRGSHAWKADTYTRTWNPKTKKWTTTTITHNLNYTGLSNPIQVWGVEQTGQRVDFTLSNVAGSQVPVWTGGQVWGGEVPLTGSHALASITARWNTGATETIPWPMTGGSNGSVAWHLLSNPQALHRWQSDIQTAAQTANSSMPPQQFGDAIGAVMLHESGGIPNLWADGVVGGAYGLMQLEPATAKGLPGYYVGARHNPAENLVLGAELLSELYTQTHSWHFTFAEYYYGSLPRGYTPGMPWSEAASLYNFVPSGGNTETVADYADQMVAEMASVAHEDRAL